MPVADIADGHQQQVAAYKACVLEGRAQTHGVLAGGDWNEVMDGHNAITTAMREAGLRCIANGHLDALFASPTFKCLAVEVLHPPKPADHPWLLVTVEFPAHSGVTTHQFRVLVANTHVGDAIALMKAAVREHKAHLVLTQENQAPADRARLRKAFPRWTWVAAGFAPKSTGLGAAGTQVLARRRVFKLLGSGNELVTPFRDKWHPTRRVTYADLWHRRAGAKFRAISGHTWTLGGS